MQDTQRWSDKSSESETYGFASCVSSPKTNDSFSTVDVKILQKSDVKDPSPTNGFPSCSFKENVKPPRNLYNFPSVVLKATYVPADSRNSSASISAGRSIPAASRNRPASIHAGTSLCDIEIRHHFIRNANEKNLIQVTQNWMVITFHVPFWNQKWLVQGGTALELASPEQTATDQMLLFHDPIVFGVPAGFLIPAGFWLLLFCFVHAVGITMQSSSLPVKIVPAGRLEDLSRTGRYILFILKLLALEFNVAGEELSAAKQKLMLLD
nr:hypothetical protein [Tanacetum cinerariifolium]